MPTQAQEEWLCEHRTGHHRALRCPLPVASTLLSTVLGFLNRVVPPTTASLPLSANPADCRHLSVGLWVVAALSHCSSLTAEGQVPKLPAQPPGGWLRVRRCTTLANGPGQPLLCPPVGLWVVLGVRLPNSATGSWSSDNSPCIIEWGGRFRASDTSSEESSIL